MTQRIRPIIRKKRSQERAFTTLQVHSVNERRLPVIDDEFAKDHGDFKSLDEFKDKLRRDIEKHKQTDQHGHYKEEITKKLIEANQFAVPETLVKFEAENLMQEYAYTLQRSGGNLQDASIDWNELYQKFSEQAERNVRGVMIIQAIADAEKIEVTDEDVEQSICAHRGSAKARSRSREGRACRRITSSNGCRKPSNHKDP